MTLLAFIVAIALLVTFHELGHYWVARLCGVQVLRFSLGFGPVIFRKIFAGSSTEWVISLIPLGGYVKMLDEREGDVPSSLLHQAFNQKAVLQKMAIVIAGPLANFLLAIVIYWIMFMHGVQGYKPVLGDIPPNTPAAIAQFLPGEKILSINEKTVTSWQELQWNLMNLALQQGEVNIEGQDVNGINVHHLLSLNSISARDLDGDFLAKLGLRLFQPVLLPVIGKLTASGVAQQAGLQPGDVILRANGVLMHSWADWVGVIRASPGRKVTLDVQRAAAVFTLSFIPETVQESGAQIGRVGAAPKVDESEWQAMLVTVRYDAWLAFIQSLNKTGQTAVISLKMLGKMLTGDVSLKNLSGPLTIADYAGQSAQLGWIAYVGFLALISISLGVLNLLPVPLLDGGHLLYYVVQVLKGSPVSERVWEIGQKIGIAMLGTLMLLALYNDIHRLFSGQ